MCSVKERVPPWHIINSREINDNMASTSTSIENTTLHAIIQSARIFWVLNML